jgi:hypothetical protein
MDNTLITAIKNLKTRASFNQKKFLELSNRADSFPQEDLEESRDSILKFITSLESLVELQIACDQSVVSLRITGASNRAQRTELQR